MGARPGHLFVVWARASGLHSGLAQPSESTVLVERAQDFYYRYSRADNEAAIELYERILAREPDKVDALAGLSNALVQRIMRWPQQPDGEHAQFTTLSAALANGHLQSANSRRVLERAELLASRALELAPEDPLLHRSLGLVLGAQARIDEAIAEYRTAIAIDADAWGAMINLDEMLELSGDSAAALESFMAAHAAMTRRYADEKQHISPWFADLTVLIGDRLVQANRIDEAEAWFQRALLHAPLNPGATAALAAVLVASGRDAEAQQLCAELSMRVGAAGDCSRSAP